MLQTLACILLPLLALGAFGAVLYAGIEAISVPERWRRYALLAAGATFVGFVAVMGGVTLTGSDTGGVLECAVPGGIVLALGVFAAIAIPARMILNRKRQQ